MLISSVTSALGAGGIITIFFVTSALIVWLIVWIVSAHHKLKDLEPVRRQAQSLANAAELIPKIYGMLLDHYGKDAFDTTSPVPLTDYGKTLSQEIDAQCLVEKYKGEIKKDTANMNAYEIQQYCFAFAENKDVIPASSVVIPYIACSRNSGMTSGFDTALCNQRACSVPLLLTFEHESQ